ncbi:uncharacterized protein LOC135372381 [Ornithodoros turicata]|uniref:uncharacterized protein LOC135372381 n=1 Tax=Ornithodoros turicata TaxID=34597 RepID=UPI003139CD6B
MARLRYPFVDSVMAGLSDQENRLSSFLGIPTGITSQGEVSAAVQAAKKIYVSRKIAEYNNKALFAHRREPSGNAWLYHDSRLLKDGDRIRALRLRTNLYPTRALSNRQASDPKARECQFCPGKEETAFHILQGCEKVHLPRVARHNFVADQVSRLCKKYNPNSSVVQERVYTTSDGVRLKPDIVISEGSSVTILDIAVAWDAAPNTLEDINAGKIQKYAGLISTFPDKQDLSCHICGVTSSSRTKYQEHYLQVHNTQLSWRCSICQEKEFALVRSISSHLTKCSKKHPAASQPAVPIAALQATQQEVAATAPPLGQRPALGASGAIGTGIISHGRWTDSELRALANMEVTMFQHPFINQELAKRFTSRSLMSIRMQRHQKRYKDILRVALQTPGVAALSTGEASTMAFNTPSQPTDNHQVPAGGQHSQDNQMTPPVARTTYPLIAQDWAQEERSECTPPRTCGVPGGGGAAAAADGGPGLPDSVEEPMETDRLLTTIQEAYGPESSPSDVERTGGPSTSVDPTDISQLADLLAEADISPPNLAFEGQQSTQGPAITANVSDASKGCSARQRSSATSNNDDGGSVGEAAGSGLPGSTAAAAVAAPFLGAARKATEATIANTLQGIRQDFNRVGITDGSLAERIVSGPLQMEDLMKIFGHFGVNFQKPQNQRGTVRTNRQAEHVPQLSQHQNAGNRKIRKKNKFNKHQRLYRLGPRVLLHQLLSEDASGEPTLALEDIHKFYDPLMSGSPPPLQRQLPSLIKTWADTSEFDLEEVTQALRAMDRKAAPGPDRVSVDDLLAVPPEILRHVLNNFFHYKSMPGGLKQARTVFIPKKATPSLASDVRPITMAPMLSRLYSRVLLKRLTAENTFHPLQGGFQDDRGTSTNLLALQALMKIMKKQKRSFYAVSLDVKKAFDCVSHEAIAAAVRGRDIPEHYVQVLMDLYSGCSTTFCWNGKTDGREVPVTQGIKQGDPLSPFLFNSVLDPLLQQANTSGLGVQIDHQHAAAMAFADDVLLFSSSLEGLKALVRLTEGYLGSTGLTINPVKSQYFGWRYDGTTKWFNYDIQPLSIGGTTITPRGRDTPVTYLGLRLYINRPSRIEDAMADRMVELIKTAALKPFQKLRCVNQLVLPRLLYQASNILGLLTQATKRDKAMRKIAKQLLHLPQSFPNAHVHLPNREGGLGVLHLEWVAAAVQFKAMARMARLTDPFVDALLTLGLDDNLNRLASHLGIPRGITDRHEIARLLRHHNPEATVEEERLLTSVTGVRLKPDLIFKRGGEVIVLDTAIAWDASSTTLSDINRAKVENGANRLIVRLPLKGGGLRPVLSPTALA